jgi:uncharacterized protein YjbI with pentapeptide repeats
MANPEHVRIARSGSEPWNAWRLAHQSEGAPDLSGADLAEVELSNGLLSGADLSHADLTRAMLQGAQLYAANLEGANLSGAVMNLVHAPETSFRRAKLVQTQLRMAELSSADFEEADLSEARAGTAVLAHANFMRAKLRGASFSDSDCRLACFSQVDAEDAIFHQAFLRGADFSQANVRSANFTHAVLGNVNFCRADLTGCRVHGVAAWDVRLEETIQKELIITPELSPSITVDRLEVAQFAYLLLNNPNLRQIIDTVTAKSVLILGRFTPERKPVLETLRNEMRRRNFIPVVFDFDRPASRDLTETVKTLTGLSRFVIADITNPRSSPLELQASVPDFMIPFVPILQKDEAPFAMFAGLQNKYDWVMDVLTYDTTDTIVQAMDALILKPALRMHAQLMARKGRQIRTRDMQEALHNVAAKSPRGGRRRRTGE